MRRSPRHGPSTSAAEITWGLFTQETVRNLMGVHGWSLDEYADFVADGVERLLLEPREPARSRDQPRPPERN
jgi:hypothetical protein